MLKNDLIYSGGANTFLVEPKDEEKFYPSKVRKVIQEIIDDKLKDETNDANNTPILAEELVKRIRSKVRDSTKMPRFKIAIQVIIGEVKGQGCKVTSKNLWDPAWDNYASYCFQNETIYGVAIVFGVYYE
ncbi:unnamed protein product [Paramecium sonneborni]|uniref:Uncharacterized protein n=1 Tax=Paramecium sonneborni TaxID=65129 RepID=A0A8S1MFF8_9CILI|nr:unnamed protein product [Paramecium sonneborni]CAD8075368.1 unnamed protein product [Paramecium sonneborni]